MPIIMFTSKDVTKILGISKSTLFRYEKDLDDFNPGREWMGLNLRRSYGIADIMTIALHRTLIHGHYEAKPREIYEKIALYGLALAVTEQNRQQNIMQGIEPIIHGCKTLEVITEAYQRQSML